MLKFIVLIAVIAVIVFVLMSNIRIHVEKNETLQVLVKFIFVKLDVMKLIEKRKSKPKKEKTKKEAKSPEEKTKKLFDNTNQVLAIAKRGVSGITKTIVFEDIDISLTVGTDDAKNTAMICGYAYSAVCLIDPFLSGNFKVEKKRMSVQPMFNTEIFDLKARVWVKARLISIIIFAVSMLMAYRKIKKENPSKKLEKKPAAA